MRLTILNQYYPPDLAPTGRLAASLAEHRAGMGDQVAVVTGRGRYVSGTALAPTAGANQVRIHRLWTPGLGRGNLARRLIDYAWFYLAAAVRLVSLPRQDLIISLTTPPFVAWTAVLHGWLHPATRLILWNMDCFPEALIRAALVPENGWVARLLRWQNHWLIRQLDRVVCLDPAMERLLAAEYAGADRPLPTCVVPNWEPFGRFDSQATAAKWDLSEVLGTELPPYVIHMGNAGYGHDFATTAEAAQALQAEPVGFVFIGGGARWSWLEAAKHERALANWHLIPYLPEDQLAAALSGALCALITLRDSFLGVISPSKLHAALALGLPVLYIGPEGSNVDEAIRRYGCGVSLRHGDVQGVIGFLRRLTGDTRFHEDLRRRARTAFGCAYTDRQALPAFDALIEELRR